MGQLSSAPRAPTDDVRGGRFAMHACWAYTLLILYGSWFPFSHLISPARPLFSFLVTEPSYDRADLIQNLLIYMPLGLFMVAWLNASRRFGPALACATLTGTLLSFTVESVQQFLPERVASLSDLVLNAVGTWVGGWLAIFVSRDTLTGKKMLSYRNHVFREGAMVNVAIAVLGLWVLSQTSPLVPSLDPAHLRHGFAMLKQSYQHPERFDLLKFSIYSSYVLALGLLAVSAVRADRSAFGLFAGVVGAVLVGKVLVVTRQLAAEALLGALTACIVLLPLRRLSGGWLSLIGMTAILSGFAVFELAPGAAGLPLAFNWVPFAGQMQSLGGLENILELLWPFMALAYFARIAVARHRRAVACVFGSMLVLAYLFAMEWWQQYLPGRYGDITQVALGFAGWLLPWWLGRSRRNALGRRQYSA